MAAEDQESLIPRAIVEKLLVLALLAGLVGGVVGGWGWQKLETLSPTAGKELVLQENSAVIDVAKKVSPSVVSITTVATVNNVFGFGQTEEGAGTGMVVSSDGLILTNKHVVPVGTASVKVFTNDGKELDGTVVARDPSNDLAFVKVNANLPAVQLGDSSKAEVGQRVIAIGNALGQFQNSVTYGVISGVGRPIQAGDETGGSSESLQDLFQTDAAINPGNSGGPMVNLAGQVIGINTAIAGDAQNIGFAIPINEAKGDISSYEKNKKIVKPFLGVRFIQITKEFAASRNLPVSDGAYVDADGANPIVDGSPAAKAGIKAGDIITKVGNEAVDSKSSLTALISEHQPGDRVALTILRNGKTQVVNVTLTEAPSQ